MKTLSRANEKNLKAHGHQELHRQADKTTSRY